MSPSGTISRGRDSGHDPALTHRDRLATRLRELRRGAHLTGAVLARQTQMSQSKISKIETGKQLPSVADVERIAKALRAPVRVQRELIDTAKAAISEYESWRKLQSNGLGAGQDAVRLRESAVKLIRTYQSAVVPGLLQTAEYARRILTLVAREDGDIEAAVAARMRRQEALYVSDKQFGFVIDEVALRRRYGPDDVLLGQLDRLTVLATLSNVDIAVLPLSAELDVIPQTSFAIYDDNLVEIELGSGQVGITDPPDVAAYVKEYEGLMARAAVGKDAIEIVGALRAAQLAARSAE